MRLPAISGIIDRRILANYRIAPETMAAALPKPFRPQVIDGWAVGGICLIRLKKIRPKFLPIPWGIYSENAAHRIAVEWDENGVSKTGVYIPRRDTNSRLNSMAGGTLFPGIHHFARFEIAEHGDQYSVTMNSQDGKANVHVAGNASNEWTRSSVFESLSDASEFFEQGSLGYSETGKSGKYDGLELRCQTWNVEVLEVESVRSSYFQNADRFPPGTVEFDCALLMKNIKHEWHGQQDLCCNPAN